MAYTVTDWHNGETALSARNMNHIEQGIKDAHDGLANVFTKTEIFDAIYPIGTIYMSVNNVDPGTLFGGTWVEWGQGRVPVGVDTQQEEFNTVSKMGGDKTHTLTTAQMPSHTHIQNSHNHTQNSHNHTQNSHNHTQNSHNHTQNAHSHGSIKGRFVESNGPVQNDATLKGSGEAIHVPYVTYWDDYNFGSHTNTANATATNQAATATNKATTATNQAATATNIAATATNQNTGGGQAHNNLQPYITCYMWKRTS